MSDRAFGPTCSLVVTPRSPGPDSPGSGRGKGRRRATEPGPPNAAHGEARYYSNIILLQPPASARRAHLPRVRNPEDRCTPGSAEGQHLGSITPRAVGGPLALVPHRPCRSPPVCRLPRSVHSEPLLGPIPKLTVSAVDIKGVGRFAAMRVLRHRPASGLIRPNTCPNRGSHDRIHPHLPRSATLTRAAGRADP